MADPTEVSISAASISDRAADEDSLGFEPYVTAIAEFLTNSETKAPLTLSIEGEWGSGKSSFMKQLEKALEEVSQRNCTEENKQEIERLEAEVEKLRREQKRLMKSLKLLLGIEDKKLFELIANPIHILFYESRLFLLYFSTGKASKVSKAKALEEKVERLRKQRKEIRRILVKVWKIEKRKLKLFYFLFYPYQIRSYELKLYPLYFSLPKPKPRIIWFNAWRHDKSQSLWAAFALEFLEKIAEARTIFEIPSVQWGHFKLFWLRFDWEKGRAEAIRAGLVGLIVVVASVAILGFSLLHGIGTAETFVKSFSSQKIELENLQQTAKIIVKFLASGLGITVSGAGLISVFRQLKKAIGNPKIDLIKYLKAPDYDSQVDFIEKFHADFKRIVDAYAGKNNKVYVFVDDLDRCELPKAAELMQALNLMIANDPHLIFLLGMDREKVAASIAFKQKDVLPYLSSSSVTLNTAAQDTAPSARGLEYGYAFIEKFVQLSFQVPQPSETDFDNFLRKLSPTTAPKKASLEASSQSQSTPTGRTESEQAEATSEAIKDLIETTKIDVASDSDNVRRIILMIAPTLDWNPRRIKQFMNLFRLKAYIAGATGLFLSDEESPTLTLEQLGKFVAIGLRYPLLLMDLEKDSKLLANLQRYALGSLDKPTTIIYSDYDNKTKYWGNEASLIQLLQYGCAKEAIPKHLEGTIVKEDYPNYSLGQVDIKKLLSVSPPRIVSKETGVDYTQLRNFLAAKKWREADEVTYRVMLKAAKREEQRYLDIEDIEKFPCEDLQIIDRLWVHYSKTPDHPNGKWGFSIQKQIWQECGSPMGYNDDWGKFGDRVGWQKEGDWLHYSEFTYDLTNPLKGEYPFLWGGRMLTRADVGRQIVSLFSRNDL